LALNATIEAALPANPGAFCRRRLRGQGAGQPDPKATEEISAQLRRCSLHQRCGGRDSGITQTIGQMSEITVSIPRQSISRAMRRVRSPAHPVGGGWLERDQRPYRRRHHGGSGDRHGGTDVLSNARELDNQSACCAAQSTDFCQGPRRVGWVPQRL